MDYLLNERVGMDSDIVKGLGVLNLIINGLPSKLNYYGIQWYHLIVISFKPYYKWITF